MVTLVTGIPASGKSTYCQNKNNFCFDSWVKQVTSASDVEEAVKIFMCNKDKGAILTHKLQQLDTNNLHLDMCIVKADDRKFLLSCLKAANIAHVNCVYLLCPLYTAIIRNRTRIPVISDEAIYSAFTRQEFPTVSEGFANINFIVSC